MTSVVQFRQPPERPLPQSVELEQAVLGSLIMHNELWGDLKQLLKAEHFVEELHRRTYEVAGSMIDAGQKASPVTLKTYLGDHDLGGLTISQYLARLAAEALPSYAGQYARLIVDLAARREIITVAQKLVDLAHDSAPDTRPGIIAAQAVNDLQEISRSGADESGRVEARAGAAALIERIEEMQASSKEPEYCSTGFAEADKKTGGYEEGLLWIIGARPSQGKTTHMVSSAFRVARRAMLGKEGGRGVLAFSLEDDQRQTTARLLAHAAYAARASIPYGSIYRGWLEPEQTMRLREVAASLEEMPLVFDFKSKPSIDQIAHRVRTEKIEMARRGHRLGLVFVDYLDFVKASDRYRGNRNHEKGEVSKGLKLIARDEGVCVVLYSQLSRAAEDTPDKRPTLATLRDSGELEQDGNVVAFLHREAYYLERSAEFKRGDTETVARLAEVKNACELIIAKNKAGPIGTVNLFVDMASSHMSNAHHGGMFP